MKSYILFIIIFCAATFGGVFFIPGAYWTFDDGTVTFLYVQGEHSLFGWTLDGRYALSGDYWLEADARLKLIGEGTGVNFKYSSDSLSRDYRKLDFGEGEEGSPDTNIWFPYKATELSAYLRQNFKAGPANKFHLYAGYLKGEYESDRTFDILSGGYNPVEEVRKTEVVDVGFSFSIDSREDLENPQTAYYFGMRLGGLYFPNSDDPDFDYLDNSQLAEPEKWHPEASGYIELENRFYGKLQVKEVPFPLIMAMRIGAGHHITEVPQIVAFKAGEDDFLRGIDKRHLVGRSYYLWSCELRAQVWEKSYTPLVLLHWIIPGYANPRPILEIAPFVDLAKIYGDYARIEKQQWTIGLGLRWVFTDYTVLRFDFGYWNHKGTFGTYFSFNPSI